jgi:hypothetical protein
MECYVFSTPPNSRVYVELVQFGCAVASQLLLVVRDPQIDPGERIRGALLTLQPYLIKSGLASQWPGTILLSADKATLYWYRVAEGLETLLLQMQSDLFEWVHPQAPEDPCFCRDDDGPILVTISHEHDAYLLLSEVEIALMRSRFPVLAAAVRSEG